MIPELKKTALVTGASGQDGSYLVKLLLNKGYVVWITSRAPQVASFQNWKKIGIHPGAVHVLAMVPEDLHSVCAALAISTPDEIYHLSGLSSVGLSFDQPIETFESTAVGTLNILEACRLAKSSVRIYSAGSSECFGDTSGQSANESTPLRPSSPYAVGKSTAFWLVENYRRAYGIYACTGILFNHESPLRPARFVSQKIISAAKRIAAGSRESLKLGRIDISRDWGWAPEYVEAMWLMLQQDEPDDYVIATGYTDTLESFVSQAFGYLGLDWETHVVIDPAFCRPTDVLVSRSDPTKAKIKLGWEARYKMKDVVRALIEA